jgi:gliding motility-associated-like protein
LPQNEIDVFRGDKTQLNIIHGGENYTSLLWTPAGNLSCSDCPNPFLNTNVNLQLKVLGTTLYFCRDSASLKVNTFYQSHLALPNVFTPDNDGLNDVFYVIAGKDVTAVKQFQIFNRWGEKVFEKSNSRPNEYSSGWDGNYKGKKAPMATYVYYISITLKNGATEVNKGNITLIR